MGQSVTPDEIKAIRQAAAVKVGGDLLASAAKLLGLLTPLAQRSDEIALTVEEAARRIAMAEDSVRDTVELAARTREDIDLIVAEVETDVAPALAEVRTLAANVGRAAQDVDAKRSEAIGAQEAVIAAKAPTEAAARAASDAADEAASERQAIAALLASLGIPHRWDGTKLAIRLPDGTFGPETDVRGAPGLNGKSAYQVALDQGFTGTVEEWLASLKGSGADGAAVIADGAINPNTTWSSFKLDAALSAVAASVRPVRYPADIGLRDRTISAEAAPGDTVFELDPDLGLAYRLLVGGSIFDLDEHDRIVFAEAPEGETTYPVEVEALTLEGWRKVFRVSITTGVLLRLLGLSSASFFDIDPPGTVIGSIRNRHAASIIAEVLSDDRMVVQDDGTTARLVVGDTASAAGDTFASIRETSGTATKTTAIPVRVNQRTKQVVGGVAVSGVASATNLQIGDQVGGGEALTIQNVPVRDRTFPLRLPRTPLIGDGIASTEFLP